MLTTLSKQLFNQSVKHSKLSLFARYFSVGHGHPPAENENPVRFNFVYTRDT